jgi:hypothetical protein
MSTQGINITVQDGGLGQTPPGQGNVLAVIGVASGTGQEYKPIATSNAAAIQSNNGNGPATQCAALIISESGNPVIFDQAVTAVAGTNSAVKATVPGGGTSTVTLTGAPIDTLYGLVSVLIGGTVGTTGMQIGVSLDAGRSTLYTVNLGTATSYAIPGTGITVNFGAGTLVAGDSYSWVSTEPKWNQAGVASAIQALYGFPVTFEDIIVVGDAAGADATTFDTYVTNLFNKRKYTTILGNARDAVWGGTSTETEFAWITALESDFANVSTIQVGISAGHYNVISPIDESQYRRPLSWLLAARDAQVAIQVDLGRVSDGALAPLVLPSKSDGFIYHDESVNPGLDAARFMAAWSLTGLPGLYNKNPNLMAPPGSDFNWLQHRHVMMAAATLAYAYFVQKLSGSVRVDAKTGFILEVDRQRLQQGMNSSLATNLTNQGAVSSAVCTVSPNDNILSTSTLSVTISVIPLGYIKAINIVILFVNPAIAAVNVSAGGS